jgi:hypothetical protein
VESHVGERGGRPQHARQAGAAHHVVRGAVSFQDVERGVADPAVVSELGRNSHPSRQATEEVVETMIVAGVVGDQLHEQDAPAIGELVRAGREPRRPRLRGVQPLGVGQASTRLGRHHEPVRQSSAPPGPRVAAGQR